VQSKDCFGEKLKKIIPLGGKQMSKTRKILSLVLALAMIVSTFAVSAFAAASYESEKDIEAGKYNQTWALSEPVDNGGNTYTVDVNLTTDYATGAIQFVLTNTAAASVTYDSIALGDAIPADYNAEISAVEKVNDDGTSKVTVMIIPTTYDVSSITAKAINGVIAQFTYTLVSGSATIALDNNPSSATNPAGTLIAGRASDGNLVTSDMITGQVVAITEGAESVTIGSSVLPSDLAKMSTAEAGIIIDTSKTFGGQYAGVVYGFTQTANNTFKNKNYITNNLEATNEGDLSVVTSDGKTDATGNYGTGTVITVTGKDGGVKKYVVVIFGDVDGNGLIAVADAALIRKGMTDTVAVPLNSVKRLAANCALLTAAVPMHNIQVNDTAPVRNNIKGIRIDQAALAARHESFKTYYK
jgi:hypothetical protein